MGCDSAPQNDSGNIETLTGSDFGRHYDPQQLVLGEKIYRQYCAMCHGQNAEGETAWRKPDVDGFYPAPPLNGSGHAWHHSLAVLKKVILDGSPVDQGRMPAWGDKLMAVEVDAVIQWFQSQWPDRVYAVWYESQQQRR
jgi:mono/diheme cytochrome c family protein